MAEQMEQQWDRLLKIKTTGRDDSNADQYHYPYEPTPYRVLERLAQSGYIGKRNTLVDYGCGKGRVDFYLAYQVRCRTIGIEYEERIYKSALENQKTAVSAGRTSFFLADAKSYEVGEAADRFYFFNPFSVEILNKAMARIMESYYGKPRQMLLFFYYPSDAYVSCLMASEWLTFFDEINCMDLFPGKNPRERILIFEAAG